MTEPKRRFWQIHLSTAELLMFVAGALVYCNLDERQGSLKGTNFYEWPFNAIERFRVFGNAGDVSSDTLFRRRERSGA
jgi:hypothetical protein